ncbi:GNAT family N-acetyltransferase [Microbacterium sp. 5K110]|jgi:putative acetyltransferase|uniref:GNAT family N-acetyltransferase n=1 Tax=unclassified Microbacterium TaxID=2609290 RepID=UPI0010FCDF6A|nr:GNAT family N-acetyltransferase [Microbacterium sp. 5K110]TLF33751.1 GNAT family N-acetyltransferase [Microbacterium sp. 5K110]
MALEIHPDDLSAADTRALVTAHVSGMLEDTPPESCHALDADALVHHGALLWAARVEGELAGIGALAAWGEDAGELKSMRVTEAFLGKGIGRAILRHIMSEARARGIRSLWLETGSGDEFAAARGLYASEGFVECPPFEAYRPDPLSTFMTREI